MFGPCLCLIFFFYINAPARVGRLPSVRTTGTERETEGRERKVWQLISDEML